MKMAAQTVDMVSIVLLTRSAQPLKTIKLHVGEEMAALALYCTSQP
jgi:hypothetical protein